MIADIIAGMGFLLLIAFMIAVIYSAWPGLDQFLYILGFFGFLIFMSWSVEHLMERFQ